MMAFKFNFSLEDKEIALPNDAISYCDNRVNENAPLCSANEAAHADNQDSRGFLHRCKRHERPVNPNSLNTADDIISLKVQEGANGHRGFTLWYQNGKYIDSLLSCKAVTQNKTTLSELIELSDLKTGVYEGGFKIWECSIDLIDYLASNNICIEDKDVLELGCGGGLPGIFCFLNGANSVCFQDFNEEVIDYFTIPNFFLNTQNQSDINFDKEKESDSLMCKTMFLSGDWRSVHTFLKEENRKFDLLLSSETIYNTQNYPVFHDLICCCLKKNGYALLANKSYYFGVGGSLKEFIEYVEKQGKLQCNIMHQITDGVNRDILQLSFK